MAATPEQVRRLRRMVAEPTEATYSDSDLIEYIERCPLNDAEGVEPDCAEWVPTYDLNRAAAEVWAEKAAGAAGLFNYSADGASYSRSEAYAHAAERQRFFASRRQPRAIKQVQ